MYKVSNKCIPRTSVWNIREFRHPLSLFLCLSFALFFVTGWIPWRRGGAYSTSREAFWYFCESSMQPALHKARRKKKWRRKQDSFWIESRCRIRTFFSICSWPLCVVQTENTLPIDAGYGDANKLAERKIWMTKDNIGFGRELFRLPILCSIHATKITFTLVRTTSDVLDAASTLSYAALHQ